MRMRMRMRCVLGWRSVCFFCVFFFCLESLRAFILMWCVQGCFVAVASSIIACVLVESQLDSDTGVKPRGKGKRGKSGAEAKAVKKANGVAGRGKEKDHKHKEKDKHDDDWSDRRCICIAISCFFAIFCDIVGFFCDILFIVSQIDSIFAIFVLTCDICIVIFFPVAILLVFLRCFAIFSCAVSVFDKYRKTKWLLFIAKYRNFR